MKCDRCNEDVEILDEGNIIPDESICKTCALKLTDLTKMAIRQYENELQKSEDFLRKCTDTYNKYKHFVESGEKFVNKDKELLDYYRKRLELINNFGG